MRWEMLWGIPWALPTDSELAQVLVMSSELQLAARWAKCSGSTLDVLKATRLELPRAKLMARPTERRWERRSVMRRDQRLGTPWAHPMATQKAPD
jgi:hypothetical protein